MTKKEQSMMEEFPLELNNEWKQLSGKLPVRMTNDYLFRALIQSDTYVRNAIIASLLGVPISDIAETTVENPILLGRAIDKKDFFLDIKVRLNGRTMINLEMQVVNEHNWPERSLGYLCRCFDSLNEGDAYDEARPACQFAFLDFVLFKDSPEFFARYMLQNVKNHRIYTDKFQLGIVDLTNIELATDEDKSRGLVFWAELFKAQTWEDLRMLATEDKNIDRAISSVYQLTEDERIREQCRQREEYYIMRKMEKRRMNRLEMALGQMEEKLGQTEEKLGQTKEKLGQTEEKPAKSEETIRALQEEIERLKG